MAKKGGNADLFDQPALEFEINGVVIPDDHSVFKLFPGKTYRLAKVMRESDYVFLDIQGLEALRDTPDDWADEKLLNIISVDRMMRDGANHGRKKRQRRGSEQDAKRLGFLKTLFFDAKRGDLVLVPLGEGYGSKIAIGELVSDQREIKKFPYECNDEHFETYGRKVKWIGEVQRNRITPDLVKSIHSPTALHIIRKSFREEIYVHAYGTFTFGDIYVAKFPSTKEVFSTQDYANIGVLFNGFAVVHDLPGGDAKADESFYELALLEENSATIELYRNSPISVILRTVGPLAFSAAVFFSGAAEGKDVKDMRNVQVSARPIGSAQDKCKITVPADVSDAAVGFGIGRYKTYCKVRTKVEDEASVKSPARLKKSARKPK